MNLHDYFLSGAKRQSQLARDIGAHPVVVSQWTKGARRVPAEYCPSIERETAGAVRCEDLRPDVDWGVVRHSAALQLMKQETA
jgi:DNA-binding transcriptional regulator YdaS (Cro superfamily)